MIRKILILTFLLITPSRLLAAEYKYCNDYEFKFFLIKIYDISLCNDQSKEVPYDDLYRLNFSLIINYDKNIKSAKLVETSIEEIQKSRNLNGFEKASYQKTLDQIFPTVSPNDVIEAKYNKAGFVDFYYNKKFTGKIDNKKFAQEFLDIWLGQNASYPEMRNNLLNEKNN